MNFLTVRNAGVKTTDYYVSGSICLLPAQYCAWSSFQEGHESECNALRQTQKTCSSKDEEVACSKLPHWPHLK